MNKNKYEGDLGEYPLHSLKAVPKHFENIVYSTNAISNTGNKGLFVLSDQDMGFLSYSIFGMNEEHKYSLEYLKRFKHVGNCLVVNPVRDVPFDQGNPWESVVQSHIASTEKEMILVFSSEAKSKHIDMLINFQIGVDSVHWQKRNEQRVKRDHPIHY